MFLPFCGLALFLANCAQFNILYTALDSGKPPVNLFWPILLLLQVVLVATMVAGYGPPYSPCFFALIGLVVFCVLVFVGEDYRAWWEKTAALIGSRFGVDEFLFYRWRSQNNSLHRFLSFYYLLSNKSFFTSLLILTFQSHETEIHE